jgi:hypothetical protein
MKLRYIIAAISAVSALVAAVVLALSVNLTMVEEKNSTEGGITAATESALKACSNLPQQDIGDCQIKVIDERGLDILTAVTSVAAMVSNPTLCHSAAHDLGKRLWSKLSVLLLDEIPYDTCNYGVVHGAITAAALDVEYDELIKLIEGVCPAEDGACWHGTGHAFTEIVDTPEETIELCLSITQSRMCIGGMAMEYALQDEGHGFEICSSLVNEDQFECDLQVSYALGGKMNLSEDYIQMCIELERDGCILGAGWTVYSYLARDLKGVEGICDKFNINKVTCYAGALSIKVTSEGTVSDIVGECAKVYDARICEDVITQLSNNRK